MAAEHVNSIYEKLNALALSDNETRDLLQVFDSIKFAPRDNFSLTHRQARDQLDLVTFGLEDDLVGAIKQMLMDLIQVTEEKFQSQAEAAARQSSMEIGDIEDLGFDAKFAELQQRQAAAQQKERRPYSQFVSGLTMALSLSKEANIGLEKALDAIESADQHSLKRIKELEFDLYTIALKIIDSNKVKVSVGLFGHDISARLEIDRQAAASMARRGGLSEQAFQLGGKPRNSITIAARKRANQPSNGVEDFENFISSAFYIRTKTCPDGWSIDRVYSAAFTRFFSKNLGEAQFRILQKEFEKN